MKKFSPKAMAVSLAAVTALSAIPVAAAVTNQGVNLKRAPWNNSANEIVAQQEDNERPALPEGVELSEDAERPAPPEAPRFYDEDGEEIDLESAEDLAGATVYDAEGNEVVLDENGMPTPPEGEERDAGDRPELPEGAESGERPGGQEPTFDADGNIVLPEDFDGELDENGAPVRPEGEQNGFGPMNGDMHGGFGPMNNNAAPEMDGERPELPEGAENGERPGGQEPTFDADGNIVLPEDFDGELDENGAPVRPEGEQGNFGPMNGMAPEMNGELPALPEGMEPGERPEDGAENGGFPGMPGGEQGFGGMQGGQSFGDEQGFGGMQGGQSFDGPQSFGGSQGGPDMGGFGGRR